MHLDFEEVKWATAERDCPVCSKPYSFSGKPHRHRASVAVPSRPWGVAGAVTEWVHVGLIVDFSDPEASELDTINRAIRKVHGPRTWWSRDSGLQGWGQVFRRLPDNGGHSAVTSRVPAPELNWARKVNDDG